MDARSVISVTLRCRDVGRMATFYQRIVGLDVLSAGEERVTLGSYGRALIHLVSATDRSADPPGPGLYHLALLVPARWHLGVWLRRYRARGGPGWQGASDHGVSEALYLNDPEDNGIEVYCDRPRSLWQVRSEGHVIMKVDPLDLNDLLGAAAASPAGDLAAPLPFTLGHVHLQVQDLAAAEAFYTQQLDLQVTARFRDSAVFLAWDGYHHHLGLNTWRRMSRATRRPEEPGLEALSIENLTAPTDQATLCDPSGVRIVSTQGV